MCSVECSRFKKKKKKLSAKEVCGDDIKERVHWTQIAARIQGLIREVTVIRPPERIIYKRWRMKEGASRAAILQPG